MYINDSRVPISVFLDQVHADMINRYTAGGVIGQADIMEKNAKDLEKFFQNLKKDAQRPLEFIASELNKQILEDFKSLSNHGTKISKLFHRAKGTDFEKELSKVVYSVLSRVSNQNVVSNQNINLKDINIGKKRANVAFEQELVSLVLEPGVQSILEITGVETKKALLKGQSDNNLYYYLTNIEGKTDVQGYQVEINGNPSSELLSIYNLLKDATFSLKNYGNFYWNPKAKRKESSTHLRLGNTNVFRAFYGVLSELGYQKSSIVSAFWDSWYEAEKCSQVALRVNQIRFVYELIGSGLSYNNDLLKGRVKYLVYNNPDTDEIYVRSTAKIIQQILQSDRPGYENPFTRIQTLEKSFFHRI